MAIIVLQHDAANRPGRLGVTFRDHAFRLDVRRLYEGDAVPADFDGVEGVIALGGAPNVGDDTPWMQAELECLRAAHERQLPVVGVCLGAQMIAKALGGEVAPLDKPAAGFQTVAITPLGQIEPILAGMPWKSRQLCLNAQGVKTLPQGAQLLATSEACKVMAFKVGMRTYAFQHHIEADKDIMNDLLAGASKMLGDAGVTPSEVRAQGELHYANFARSADRLCLNLATYLIPARTRVGV